MDIHPASPTMMMEIIGGRPELLQLLEVDLRRA
jgi:hypothetical protein